METNEPDIDFVNNQVVGSSLSKRKKAPPSKDRSLRCKTCGKTFSNHNDRRKHELIHLPGFNYSCNQCTYRGKTKHYLSRHISKVHGEKNVKCDHCSAVFKYQCQKDVHMRVHTGEKPYKCDYCPKTFRVSYSLKSHTLIHTDKKPFECSFCAYACRDNSTLRKHQNKHMGLVKFYNCSICNKSFKHKWKLKSHISELHLQMDLKKFSCDQCGKLFRSRSHVTLHTKQVHDRVYATKCPVCDVKVSNRYNLRLHMAMHVDYRPYICTQTGCNKAFKDRGTLKKHTMIHKPELHYPCKMCDMKFSRKYRLAKHLIQHEDRKKNIICDYCQHSFYTKNYLIKHIKQKHTDRQTYVCDECGIKTINKPGMILHLKYGHERNENDRECKICHTKYKRYEYLKNHYYRTHNVRYKMVKPYGKKKPKPVRDLKAEVKVKMEPVDEDFDQIDLLDVDKEEIQEDCLEYSQSVLNEDIQACVLGKTGNLEEIEFDQFLVTHMFKKSKEEEDNVPEDVNPTILQKSKDTINELLKKSEKNRLKQEKLNKIKALAKRRERKAKMDAKFLEQKKKDEAEKKKRDEEYLARRGNEEIIEFQKLIAKYNERMKNISQNVFKKKECTKIQYFKAKTDQNTINDDDLSDENFDDISFAIKPSYDYEKYGENSQMNNINDEKDEENDEFSGDNVRFVKNNNVNGESNETSDESAINHIDIGENLQLNDNNGETNEVNDVGISEFGEENANFAKNNNENDGYNEINYELATNNSDIGENTKVNKLNDNNGEPNKVNNEEIIEFCKEYDKISVNNEHIQTKISISEDKAENSEFFEKNNEKVETDDNKNDLNEENDSEIDKIDEVFDKNNESIDINDQMDENNDIRRSKRKRKPNKLYEQEVNIPKHSKMNFKTHQCYVCFKLYPTKEELIQHCQIHFDVCSLKTLTKCPICDFVTAKSLSAHLAKKHNVHIKIPFNHIKERNVSDGSKYCYNADGTIIEVIPSVKTLNKNASMGIDKKNREIKDKSVTKTKLVRKGKEWVVEKEDFELKFDLLPQFDEKEYKKLKISDNYIDRMKQIYKLAKKNSLKMAFPCFDCDKICQNLSALKLHNRKHQINPKPFRPRGEVKKEKTKKVIRNFKNRNAKPKPIINKHKCDDELKKFYENNIRGGDIEFWQFLKIFNKIDRENITEFNELEERTDFGIHINPKNLQITEKNEPVAKNNQKTDNYRANTKNNTLIAKTSVKTDKRNLTTTKNVIKTANIDLTANKNTAVDSKNFKNINKTAKSSHKRVIMISKDDYRKRIEAKNRLRKKNLSLNA